MTDIERLKLAIPLLQALADGKNLENKASPSETWLAVNAVSLNILADRVLTNPQLYRIAPDPPPNKPSQEWLDKHGVELTGECRVAVTGELTHCIDFGTTKPLYDSGPLTIHTLANVAYSSPRWILRRKPPVEKLEPWTIETVPLPLVVKSISPDASAIYQVAQVNRDGVFLLFKMNSQLEPTMRLCGYTELLEDFVQRDGQPCGRKVT